MEIVMSGIAKAFGTNQVLRDVSITLKEGEVHALMVKTAPASPPL